MSWRRGPPINRRRWARVRRRAFERDGWRCRKCGKAGRLEADHIRPLRRYPDQDPYDLSGVQTLCRDCHIRKTASENRRKPTATEAAWWRLIDELRDLR